MSPNKLPKALRECNIKVNTEYLGQNSQFRSIYAYELIWNGEIVFKGEDFGPSPLHMPPEGWDETLPRKAIVSLLGFLTLRKDEVEEEYFKNHTDKMWKFLDSPDCDDIRLWLYDQETKEED